MKTRFIESNYAVGNSRTGVLYSEHASKRLARASQIQHAHKTDRDTKIYDSHHWNEIHDVRENATKEAKDNFNADSVTLESLLTGSSR